MFVQTDLPADHPVVQLCIDLDKVLAGARVDHSVALSALLSLYVAAAKRHRCCGVTTLQSLHYAASQIAAVHFPEMQFDPVMPTSSQAH
jgi:hypothetical protein